MVEIVDIVNTKDVTAQGIATAHDQVWHLILVGQSIQVLIHCGTGRSGRAVDRSDAIRPHRGEAGVSSGQGSLALLIFLGRLFDCRFLLLSRSLLLGSGLLGRGLFVDSLSSGLFYRSWRSRLSYRSWRSRLCRLGTGGIVACVDWRGICRSDGIQLREYRPDCSCRVGPRIVNRMPIGEVVFLQCQSLSGTLCDASGDDIGV